MAVDAEHESQSKGSLHSYNPNFPPTLIFWPVPQPPSWKCCFRDVTRLETRTDGRDSLAPGLKSAVPRSSCWAHVEHKSQRDLNAWPSWEKGTRRKVWKGVRESWNLVPHHLFTSNYQCWCFSQFTTYQSSSPQFAAPMVLDAFSWSGDRIIVCLTLKFDSFSFTLLLMTLYMKTVRTDQVLGHSASAGAYPLWWMKLRVWWTIQDIY